MIAVINSWGRCSIGYLSKKYGVTVCLHSYGRKGKEGREDRGKARRKLEVHPSLVAFNVIKFPELLYIKSCVGLI